MKSILISLVAAGLLCAQAPELVTNIVVTDRKGVPMKAVDASAFEVRDDGKKIAAKVKAVDGGERLFAIVFEGMDNNARRLAKQIANDLLTEDQDPNHLYAVFMIANQLSLLQPFTADRAKAREAVELATSGAQNTKFAEVSAEQKAAAKGTDKARLIERMMSFRGALPDGEGTRRSIASLNSLVSGLAGEPGRKTLVYMTWGIVVPTHLDVPFQSMQARANRGGVAIYGVACGGLDTGSLNSGVTDALERAGPQVDNSGLENRAAVNTSGIEQVAEGLRNNTQSNLRVMSESTSGMLIADTNDPKKFLRQMIAEASTYYEVSYPMSGEMDGTYRKMAVKVNARDSRVRDRDGYFALPIENGGEDLLPYELPLMKAVAANPAPREIEFRSGAFRLRHAKDSVDGSVLVEVPLANLTYKEEKGQYLARVSVMVRLKEPSGEVIEKFSQDLPLQGKQEQLAALKNSNFSFREQFQVKPGRYVIEAAVVDHFGPRTAVRRTSFLASGADGISLSSISMVRNYQPNAKNLSPDEFFQFQGGQITPTLQADLKKAPGARMAFFFTVHAPPGSAPAGTVEYLKDGTVVGQSALQLPKADEAGRIRYVLSSPLDAIPPGGYQVRVTVSLGDQTERESTMITVVE